MTKIQEFMLFICFGCAIGFFVGNVVFLISDAIDRHKRKKNRK